MSNVKLDDWFDLTQAAERGEGNGHGAKMNAPNSSLQSDAILMAVDRHELAAQDYVARGGMTLKKFSPRDDTRPGDHRGQNRLRGRGGAGFPTGEWSFMPKQYVGDKCVVCNSDEASRERSRIAISCAITRTR